MRHMTWSEETEARYRAYVERCGRLIGVCEVAANGLRHGRDVAEVVAYLEQSAAECSGPIRFTDLDAPIPYVPTTPSDEWYATHAPPGGR